MKIMIVDDEADVVESVKTMLKSEGFEVITATSGIECLNKLKDERPEYIFLDVAMPGMDGWETLKAIKEDENLRSIPVSMLTADPLSTETIKREDVETLVDYITKPFTKRDLVETLKQTYDLG